MGQLEDLLGILKGANLGGFDLRHMDSSAIFRTIVLKTLKDMHSQMGRIIDEATGAGFSYDPFQVLGIAVDATDDEIKKAYKERAKACHPDKGGSDEEMAKINIAYEIISRLKGWKE